MAQDIKVKATTAGTQAAGLAFGGCGFLTCTEKYNI